MSRLEAKELRVGNLVYFKNTHDVAKVELIHNNHFDCRDEYGSFIPNGNYEPIELTEEWFLKFSFKKDEYNNDRPLYYTLKGFRLNCNLGFLTLCNSNELADFNPIKIKYVHQLQNMFFALCGEELELKETLNSKIS